jgi:hypothetical protein
MILSKHLYSSVASCTKGNVSVNEKMILRLSVYTASSTRVMLFQMRGVNYHEQKGRRIWKVMGVAHLKELPRNSS